MLGPAPRRIAALTAALVVVVASAALPIGAAPSTHAMPCCKTRSHCQTPAFGSTCCSPEQGPAAPAPLPNGALKSGPSADASVVTSTAVVAPASPLPDATVAAFLHERLKLPHDPPYLKNAAFRI